MVLADYFGVYSAGSARCREDPLQEAKAYNWSIYLMLAVPYGLFGGFGWFVYRGLKTNKAMREEGTHETKTT